MRSWKVYLVVACLLPATPVTSLAAERIALVAGNAAYKQLPRLANASNDATAVSRALRDLGFEVIEKIDTDQITMKRAIRDFGRRLHEAGLDSVGLFYYAGHGVQAQPIRTSVESCPSNEVGSIIAG